MHARGATAFGHFEATGKVGDEPISKFTRAKLFQEAGKRTESRCASRPWPAGATRRRPCATRAASR